MAIAYVQSNIASSGSSASTNVLLNGVVSGNFLAVGIATSGAGTTVTGVTDDAGNTYTRRAPRQFQSGAGGSEIWEAHGVTGGNVTVTASFSASVLNDVYFAEYSGIDASSPFDQTAGAGGSSATPSSGNITTTVADELLIGVSGNGDTGTSTAGTGYTIRQAGPFKSFYEDRIVSATGTYVADATLSVSAAWNMVVASFKAAAAGTAHRRRGRMSMLGIGMVA